jgi:hypothetical protein
MGVIDLNRLHANGRPSRRQAKAVRFLKGPVPWPWLQQAMALPGKALALGLMVWFKCGLAGRQAVRFSLTWTAAEGIPKSTARRAIRALEQAGLVTVRPLPGRGLEVTIKDVGE